MICTLTKISRHQDLEGGLRTDSVRGNVTELPTLGKRFVMLAESLTIEGVRYIDTSEVESVESLEGLDVTNTCRFTTWSGFIYELKIEIGGE